MTRDKAIKKSGNRRPAAQQRIARLEMLIEALLLELPGAALRRAGSIERQLRLHREQLRIERIHLVSKINQIRRYTVSGSYGSKHR